MRLRVPGPPGCPAAASLAEQEAEGLGPDADRIGGRPVGALAGLPAALPASRRSLSRRKRGWPVRDAGQLALGIGKSAGATLTMIAEEFPRDLHRGAAAGLVNQLHGGLCLFGHAAQPLGRRSIRCGFPGIRDGSAGNRRRACASGRTGRGPAFGARLGVLAVPADVGARLAAIRYQQAERERDAAHGALGYLQRPEPVVVRGRRRFGQRQARTGRTLLRSGFQGRRRN
jgi:hypothetical protein